VPLPRNRAKPFAGLRALQNAIPASQKARDARIAALARTGAVSRRDMARACGLNKSRIDQIFAAAST
jgi:hypothetical protein